jgi:prepilin-type N-terminal cleavage/methylation domain-containing protein
MSLNKKGKANSGFTIIEVLIVLAIAGLILLIVFLAVPALQRNSRNTQRRNDVANYLSAVNEWTNNNNGAVPTTNAHLTGTNGVNSLAKLGSLTAPTAVQTGIRTNGVGVDAMELVTGAKCSTTATGNTVGGPTRSIAVRFAVESSTGAAIPQCQES